MANDFISETEKLYDAAGGTLHELDQQLFLASVDRNAAEQERLTKLIYGAFWETPAGEKLSAVSTNKTQTLTRLLQVFAHRFGADSPLYIFRLEDCARDLLAADAEAAPVPKRVAHTPIVREPSDAEKHAELVAQIKRDMEDPAVSSASIREKRRLSAEYERAFQDAQLPDETSPNPPSAPKPEAAAEVRSFAHLLNAHVQQYGTPKPAAGFYTIKAAGKEYMYPVKHFRMLADAAAEADLIR
jgi:hypothetical protein